MRLPVRYQVMHSTGPDDNVEANIVSTESVLELDPAETALILVDVWGGHPIRSHRDRSAEIMATRLAPVLQAARQAGVTPVYAPSPRVAPNYPQWVRFAGDADLQAPPPETPDWPPPEFRAKTGKYASLQRDPGELPKGFAGPYPDWWHIRDIYQPIAPAPDDCVVATGAQLHRLLRFRKLVHLIYAGFATNICMVYRDYGLQAMRHRGYAPIILRDCTSAIETRATIDGLLLTKYVLIDLERWFYTTDAAAFVQACR
ncbi:MAG: isochorismatase family protein [Actinobacteria bacterium]|nr:isochorismatase family protein [Actinomycetota bacterium]